MAAILRIETIGRCVAYVGERRIDPTAEVVFAAVLFLGLERGRTHSRTDLAKLFWPSAEPQVQRARLRWLLAKLRSLGLTVDTGDLRLAFPTAMVKLDFSDLGELSASGISAVLPDYSPRLSVEFKSWIETQREQIGATVVRQLLARLASATRVGEWDSALGFAEAVCRIDPLNEQAALGLAEAQCRLGEKNKGLRTLERFLAELGESHADVQLQARLLEQRIRSVDSPSTRLESRFVGRDAELQAIDNLLRSTRDGAGSALMLSGPAGIGKTRLLDEAALRASMAGMQVVRIKCQRGDKNRPLGGIIELIPPLLELRGALGCDPAKLERLRRLVQGNEAQNTGNASPPTRAAWRRTEIISAILDLLDAAAEEAPVLIQVDDVQWVERSLEWFWSPVVSWSADRKVSWLFAMRTSPRWQPTMDVPRKPVTALDPAHAEQLLDDLLSNAPKTTHIDRSALLSRGVGSPLFIRELARHCIATGSTERLPMSLVSLLDTGLSKLGKYALRVLQVAAILGKHATLGRIEAIARLPRAQFLDAVAELEIEAILASDASGTMTGHILWAEAAISRMTTNVARLLHRHAAQQFEHELNISSRIWLAWECARHWEAAGEVDEARIRIIAAAENLAETGFPDDAAAAYSRAIASAVDPHERLRLMDRRLVLMSWAGYAREFLDDAEAYDRLAAELDPGYDGHNAHELHKWRAHYFVNGDMSLMMENAFRCANCPEATTEHRLEAAKICAIGAEYSSPSVLAEIRRTASTLEATSLDDRWNRYMVELIFNFRLGSSEHALVLAEREATAARLRRDSVRLMYALGHVGRACELTGDFTRAIAALKERIKIGEKTGYFTEVRAGYDSLIAAFLETNRLEEAKQALSELRRATEASGPKSQTDFTTMILSVYASQIAVMEDRFEDLEISEIPASTLDRQPARCRARFLAIQLRASLLAGHVDRAVELADRLREFFREPDGWMDWPASVYADFLGRHRGPSEAAAFARDYVHRVRPELYAPPPELAKWTESVCTEPIMV